MAFLEIAGLVLIGIVVQTSFCLAAIRFLRAQRRSIEGFAAGGDKHPPSDGSSAVADLGRPGLPRRHGLERGLEPG